LLGGIDEGAGVDDEDFGIFRGVGEARPGSVKQAHHHFAVYEVFGASQGDKAHGWAVFFGNCSHLLIVPGIEIWGWEGLSRRPFELANVYYSGVIRRLYI